MKPYLSIIITGRNDNYGVNFLDRINTFIKSLAYQVTPYPDLVELIIVEWNPPKDTLPLKDVLSIPNNLTIRVITVPPEIHNTLHVNSPMLEFYAKNVGIRRAKGEFVLVTNPDIMLTNEMIIWFAKKELNKDRVYRTDRYDYNGDGLENIEPNQYINYALSKTFLAHLCIEENNISLTIDDPADIPKKFISKIEPYSIHTNACGDFILANKESFFKVKGLWETNHQKWHLDSYSYLKFLGHGIPTEVLLFPLCIFHWDHPRKDPDVNYNLQFANLVITNPDILKSDTQDFWGLNNFILPELTNKLTTMNPQFFQHLLYTVLNGHGDSDQHLLTLFGLTLNGKCKRILELGVRNGTTTLPFLCAAKELGGHVTSVDLSPTSFNCPQELLPHWTFHESDAIAFLKNEVQQDAKYDLVYIDDWHSYDHVKIELELVDKMIGPSSMIVLHDLMYSGTHPHYHTEVNTIDAQWANGGPYRAVAELDPNIWEWATVPFNHGLTLLRKKSSQIITG
jgi:predicted O-methyltransferase YrrM